jgi:hypothetical protein
MLKGRIWMKMMTAAYKREKSVSSCTQKEGISQAMRGDSEMPAAHRRGTS